MKHPDPVPRLVEKDCSAVHHPKPGTSIPFIVLTWWSHQNGTHLVVSSGIIKLCTDVPPVQVLPVLTPRRNALHVLPSVYFGPSLHEGPGQVARLRCLPFGHLTWQWEIP
jgi:hypothetical protein